MDQQNTTKLLMNYGYQLLIVKYMKQDYKVLLLWYTPHHAEWFIGYTPKCILVDKLFV